ncbi:uncharacterized protein LOC110714344 isoform X2 [Chenopodium quinoa]|uniref:Uncharacterized protein n=1 Tax=Chenopodium quinoa TaxID=63459 RepID=A0A803KYN2_CHEQI|nr:uncharacterized protein LOC110714344 isoform X2 [Chenopodium quinoa]
MGGRPTSLASNSDTLNFASPTTSSSSVDSVFGSVPTRLEVEYAITAFQSFMMQGLSSSMSILDRLQPILNHDQLQSTGFQRVYDAFLLLQTVPYVQRMVVSISSDKAVWDAVINNNEVQEFRQSVNQAKSSRHQRSDEEPALVSMILKWILDNMKLKVLQLIESLKSVVSKSFESSQNKNTTNPELKHGFEEMIVSTVLLSTITLMIVLVTRAYGA